MNFKSRIADVVKNEQLMKSYRQGTSGHAQRRGEKVIQFPLFPAMRDKAHQIRMHALEHLPQLLQQLEQRCTENGISVLWAEDGKTMNEIVANLLTHHQCHLVLKGKSMVSEETHLNQHLEEAGFECLETDLGEYILQLGREAPSHIIAPAIHKNMEQIKSLLLGSDYDHGKIDMSEEGLINYVREQMRKKYVLADAGISGVNFAFADNGALCLVENEGNGRYTTTVPRVHIAVMGIEKVNPSFSDLGDLLKVLTLSACGQSITTYTNIITSPRKNNELDGPDHVYLILLDNGRSAMLKDRELKKALLCIRCGACLNHCPVYNTIGGHAYNTVIPGPIGQILMPQLKGLDKAGDILSASSLCGRCAEVCPVKIPITDIILKLRHLAVEKTPSSSLSSAGCKKTFSETLLWNGWSLFHRFPILYRLMKIGAFLTPNFLKKNLPIVKNWARVRAVPEIKWNGLKNLAIKNGNVRR